MWPNDTLEAYRKNAPKNREERRALLKSQGWYYSIKIGANNEWWVYKVYRHGKSELYDDYSKYDSKGEKSL